MGGLAHADDRGRDIGCAAYELECRRRVGGSLGEGFTNETRNVPDESSGIERSTGKDRRTGVV